MSITTLDQAALGRTPLLDYHKAATPTLVAHRPHSLAYLAGNPPAFAAPSPGVAGQALSQSGGAITGALRFDDGAGAVRNEVLRLVGYSSAQAGRLFLMDRIWQNSGLSVTATTAQTVNSVAFPARDENESIDGLGYGAALEVVTATGAGAPTHTITYTDSTGATGLTATLADTYAASAAAGAFHRFRMANLLGVKSLEQYQNSATMTSGAVSLVVYRVLASVWLGPYGTAFQGAVDWVTGGAGRAIANGACPFLVFVPTTTTATIIAADLHYTRG